MIICGILTFILHLIAKYLTKRNVHGLDFPFCGKKRKVYDGNFYFNSLKHS